MSNEKNVAEQIVVTIDRSAETIVCPNCNRTQCSNRSVCYNCNAAFVEMKMPFVAEEETPVTEGTTPAAEETMLIAEEATREKTSTAEGVPQIKFCNKCGFELIEGSEFCSKCGIAVVKEGHK